MTELRSGVAAVNVIRAGFRQDSALSSKRGLDEKFSELEEWVPELRSYSETIKGATHVIARRLNSAPILAVGLTVTRHQPEKAHDFFSAVATAAALQPGSAKHLFFTKLLAIEDSTRRAGVAALCRYTAACWNAHYENRPINQVKVFDPSRPIILLGTPFTKRERNADQI